MIVVTYVILEITRTVAESRRDASKRLTRESSGFGEFFWGRGVCFSGSVLLARGHGGCRDVGGWRLVRFGDWRVDFGRDSGEMKKTARLMRLMTASWDRMRDRGQGWKRVGAVHSLESERLSTSRRDERWWTWTIHPSIALRWQLCHPMKPHQIMALFLVFGIGRFGSIRLLLLK